jgi:uncharacterized membrane protein
MKNYKLIVTIIVAAIIILQVFTNIDITNQSTTIWIMAALVIFWLFGIISNRATNTSSESKLEATNTEPVPLIFEGNTYMSIDEMSPDVRKRYDDLISSLKQVESERLEELLQQLAREDLVERLRETQGMMNDGLISEEDYRATKDQIISELET